jgi:hypothetical protein
LASRLARAVTLPWPRNMKKAKTAITSSMAEPIMARAAVRETRPEAAERGEGGPSALVTAGIAAGGRQARGAGAACGLGPGAGPATAAAAAGGLA